MPNKIKKVAHIPFLIALLFFSAQQGHSQDSSLVTPSMYHNYEGNYELPNGKFITGSRMDEGSEGGMVFMEPLDVTTGGIFNPTGANTFQSVIIPNLFTDTISIEFELDSNGDVEGLWWQENDQEAVFATKLDPYTIENIQFTNGDITLAGELRLPDSPGPHPVIINVHGSGRQTRHLGPWNSFFLRYGIGVLSYDKRGAGESGGDYATSGYEVFASDVIAAIDFAKQHPGIDDSRIGLHGSSEGGWVSSIVASATDDELAFLLVRVGPGVSGSETYIHEVKNELLDEDLTELEYRQVVQFERKIQEMAAENNTLHSVNTYIDEKRDETWFEKIYSGWGGIGASRWVQMKGTGPIDPVDYLRNVTRTPVLWFLAMEDENVPYELSKPRIKVALEEAGNSDFEIVSIPEANHAFFVPSEEGGLKYTDGYWDKMISWLEQREITN